MAAPLHTLNFHSLKFREASVIHCTLSNDLYAAKVDKLLFYFGQGFLLCMLKSQTWVEKGTNEAENILLGV